ncbi:MAG: BREX system P-loop protein BrxC [Firmicutes bacterium]|nr:BREX system P-loop protein BrxC [Bacillota bacterium]
MLIKDIFQTRVEEKIDPVIKVSEVQNEDKLAYEIGSYVVTPAIERYIDDFLEHYTDTFYTATTEIGVWISGYFGSGKSYLAKILALLVENRTLVGHSAAQRFEARIPPGAPRRDSILRSLARLERCSSRVLAFNINTLADSKATPLPRLLLSQYYLSKGYSSNLVYARVIEAELDKRGQLSELHTAVERRVGKPWPEVQQNLNFYARHLYAAACEVAPDVFTCPEDVLQALKNAEKGELYNVQFFVRTILEDLAITEKATGKPCRLVLVLDESGQWIEDDAGRLAQLQAFVEEAAEKGQGRIWVLVTTHEDMASVYANARALQADMKKMEGRFRFKFVLTTENIELVLEDRLLRKNLPGREALVEVYNSAPGIIRDLGQLRMEGRLMPECTLEKFVDTYPFFPYQTHLIPEVVKSLRTQGGRGEQLSGSTRTLIAITQDILRTGRGRYLEAPVGRVVSFDEVYANLEAAEINPEVRREIQLITTDVPGATLLTRRVAEVLYLLSGITYLPRTIDNLARLLAESVDDDIAAIAARIRPELERLQKAKMVARIGEEYEFLTGVRRTFEDEVAATAAELRQPDREAGLRDFATTDVLGFATVPYKGAEFPVRITFDGTPVTREGFVEVRVVSPLAALGGIKVIDLEDQSLRPEEQQTIFILCDRIPGFDQDLNRYIAMREVIKNWKGDPHKSDEAHRLASDRESNDLEKLRRRVQDGIREGLRHARVVFRGSSRALNPKPGQTPGEAIREELALYWPTLYPQYDRVPVRVNQEQKAILEVLSGTKTPGQDIRNLKLYDQSGQLDLHCPLVDAIRLYLAKRQSTKQRTLGKDLISEFVQPPYGWDGNAVRIGVAALVRAGAVRILSNKKPYTNPADPELQDLLRVSRNFDKCELILEETEVDPDVLMAVRTLLIKLAGVRKIDETPAALHQAMEQFGRQLRSQAERVLLWAEPAGFPLPDEFKRGVEAIIEILGLGNPVHRVNEIFARSAVLESGVIAIQKLATFQQKWGKVFSETKDLADQLQAIEHRLPDTGVLRSFVENFMTARKKASFAEPEIWKVIQDAKAAAALELSSLLAGWREEARGEIEAALVRLPEEIAARCLPAELVGDLRQPLDEFLAALDGEKNPVRVAALPERARQLIAEAGRRLDQEAGKRATALGGTPQKPVRKVRVAEVAGISRVRTAAEWAAALKRLDDHVRKLLDEGSEVEFS